MDVDGNGKPKDNSNSDNLEAQAALAAARIKAAEKVLLQEKNKQEKEGKNTDWFAEMMKDLGAFVKENQAELDRILREEEEEEGGNMDIDPKDPGNNKRKKPEGGLDPTLDPNDPLYIDPIL